MIDTLKLSKKLQQAGMDPAQAEAFADGVGEGLDDAKAEQATKEDLQLVRHDIEVVKHDIELTIEKLRGDLELAIEKLRSELQRFILVSVVLVAVAQILVIKLWH